MTGRDAQPPADDPFALLGLPLRFDLSRERINRAFLGSIAAAHPDSAVGDAAEREVIAARMNRAKAVLENPELRADALLTAAGGARADQDRSLPRGFLAEMMQLREEMDESLQRGGAISAWTDRAGRMRDAAMSRVGELFASAGEPPDASVLREVRKELNAWRYVERMIQQLQDQYDVRPGK